MATMKGSSEKPSFFHPIRSSFKQGISLPNELLKHLKGHDQYEHAILRWAGKEWLVKLNGVRLEDGLEMFAEQNNLEEGDTLVFKHEGDMKFEVLKFDLSNQCEIEEQQKAQKVEKTSERSKSKGAATQEHLDHSRFVCTIRPYCFKYGYLCLPIAFVLNNNLRNKIGNLIIRDEKQRSWNLRLNSFNPKRFVLNGGWAEFSVANDIKEGDEVMFEIVTNEEKPIWQYQKKSNHNIKSSLLAEPPKVKSGELSQRQDFEDLTLEVGIDKLFGNSNNNIESSPLANLPKSKSRELPQRQEFEDQTLEVVTHKSFDKSNHNIKLSPLANPPKSNSRKRSQRDDFEDHPLEVITHESFEPSKSKSVGLHQRQEFEERTLEVATHKSFDKPNHKKMKSSPLAEPSQSKSRGLPQKQNFEDQTIEVVTHKPLDKPNYSITSSKEASPLEVVPHKSHGHSYFITIVSPYCLVSDTLLIPEEFALANGLFNIKKCDLIIRDENERLWNVTLRTHNTYVIIKDGWKKIRDAHCLKEGDRIMFEVVTGGNKPIWKFHGKISEELASIIQQDRLNNE
ncbi:B3 domain-containing protein REM10-like [Solanum verrucosum]|uniref:B3 domain-containing protein REM10-like n=1 Tax=Solanum verrucosum TaxID=315347 RepID=UPI0020D09300|nr:B3 domain-containing protein REM10-like [Solanum verrucosum]